MLPTARRDSAAPAHLAKSFPVSGKDGDTRRGSSKHHSKSAPNTDRFLSASSSSLSARLSIPRRATLLDEFESHLQRSVNESDDDVNLCSYLGSGPPQQSFLSAPNNSFPKASEDRLVECRDQVANTNVGFNKLEKDDRRENLPNKPAPVFHQDPRGVQQPWHVVHLAQYQPYPLGVIHQTINEERISYHLLEISRISNGRQMLQLLLDSNLIKSFQHFVVRRAGESPLSNGIWASILPNKLEVIAGYECDTTTLRDLHATVTESELTAIVEDMKRGQERRIFPMSKGKRVFHKDDFAKDPRGQEFAARFELLLNINEAPKELAYQPLPLNAPVGYSNSYSPALRDVRASQRNHNGWYESSPQSIATSFVTAASSNIASFISARGSSLRASKSVASPSSGASISITPWRRFLRERKLLPTTLNEQNWSERGQHAEYTRAEQFKVPLQERGRILGHSATAVVDVVRCKRITLARKTIRCNQRMKREDAAKEVEHLQKVNHAHVVRIIGTYVFENRKDLHILIYPVADYDLEGFMEYEIDLESLKKFFTCLASTLAYLHKMLIKHMDIKPKNLLVRYNRPDILRDREPKIYLADFGIARSYDSALDAETCSPTSFTRIYAAPEVVAQEMRGFKADIFSLGCVFAEMVCALAGSWEELIEIRERNSSDRSFQANIEWVVEHVRHLPIQESSTFWIPQDECISMLDADPDKRPNSEELCAFAGPHGWTVGCCDTGADRLEATTISSDKEKRRA